MKKASRGVRDNAQSKMEKEYTDLFFRIGLAMKGANAALELVFGTIALFITQAYVISLATWLTQDELSEDPKDIISNYFLNAAHQLSVADKSFLAIYLIVHGAVKIVLVFNLWKGKLWAYPTALGVFSLFIVYQLYRYSYSHSSWLIALSLFDAVVLWLIWREYRYAKAVRR